MKTNLALTSCVLVIFAFLTSVVRSIDTSDLTKAPPCTCDVDGKPCKVDGYVGSSIIYEDDYVRMWNFTLAPGEMTSMHSHDYDYHFVAIQPTQLEVWGEDGKRLFDFRAEGVLGFKLVGDVLEPIGIELPWPVPRVHAAKNIGPGTYHEILFESKTKKGGVDVVEEKAEGKDDKKIGQLSIAPNLRKIWAALTRTGKEEL